MHLPFEILSQIIDYVPKSELKTLRLVCQMFYDTATPRLFDRVFVSACNGDLEFAKRVASRFPESIRILTFSSECYHTSTWPDFRRQLLDSFAPCPKYTQHIKLAKYFWKTYCKLGSERSTLYESGAVHAQLSHLLKTLPNLRQIVITDRRRQQRLCWLEEALLAEATQCLPLSETRTPLLSRIRRALSDLQGVRNRTTRFKLYGMTDFWTWFRPSIGNEDVQALVQLQALRSVDCDCFNVDPFPENPSRLGQLGHAGSKFMPQNPWAEVMKAMHTAPDVSIDTISVQPRDTAAYLPFAAISLYDPCCFLSTIAVLERLTKLELRLTHRTMTCGQPVESVYEGLQGLRKMLSVAVQLQHLTIDFMYFHEDPYTYRGNNKIYTFFGLVLSGCKLPRLSMLRLCNLSSTEEELIEFLQHSPNIRDLALRPLLIMDVSDRARLYPGYYNRLCQMLKETLLCSEYYDIDLLENKDHPIIALH